MAIRIGMVSLGCPKNQVDAEVMLAELKSHGFELVPDAALAEVVVINTCGFIEEAKQESIDQIIEFGKLKQEGRIKMLVVTGCLAERYQQELAKELPEVDVILGIGANSEIPSLIKKAFVEKDKVLSFPPKSCLPLEGERVLSTLPHYAYLKIAEGCDNRCTYCAIPSIRGPYRSRKIEDILEEAKWLASSGVKEIVLVAQDTTRYGTDLYGELSLAKLLKQLCSIEGVKWYRILYAYPECITDELLEVMASQPKVAKYLDLPLQHVDSQVLKRMNRRGDVVSLTQLIRHIRKMVPGITLRTTLIAGFPGETKQQFGELCEWVKEMKIERLGCFAYSQEENTPAALLDGQLDEETKQHRAEIVMETQMEIHERLNQKMVGKTVTLLVEGFDKYAECYFGRGEMDAPDIDGKVFFSAEEPLEFGDEVRVKIEEALDYDLIGALKEKVHTADQQE